MDPTALACAVPKDAAPSTANDVAASIVSSAGMTNPNNKNNPSITVGDGPSNPSVFAPRVYYAAKKSVSSSPTATYNSESDDDDDDDPWDREGWVPRTKSGEQKSPNTVSG